MPAVVGIPRALLYHKYSTLWKTFLEEMGVAVVMSPTTTKKIAQQGIQAAENEICLPLKLYYGHTLDLKDKVDALFIPRLVSVEKNAYTCPKLLGLPDLIRAADDDLPDIISPTIDIGKGRISFYRTVCEIGASFNKNASTSLCAYRRAARAYNKERHQVIKRGVMTMAGRDEVRIGVVGHTYNINEKFATMDICSKLRGMGATVQTPEELPERILQREAMQLPKKLFWTYEKEIVGAGFHWLKGNTVDGVIYILAFACGPDSLIQTVLEYEAKKIGTVPLISIVIDEHSGEAGLATRLEAFYDMLLRKKRAS